MLLKCTVLFLSVCLVGCLPPPHPAVVAVRQSEELLPPHLRSPALRNPHLQEILPLTSLLHHGENVVFEREADNVSRSEIYKILTHAGFLRRQNYLKQYKPEYFGNYPPSHDSSFLLNPEVLQYL
ncbi:unnamed protein product [Pieris macdunnoughi]|uniref:Uncharacterized protein n=1 Tax=Pieris macdunnoughi TaxID=345717 RepID=A0A821W3L8_9NEOP|nr:unnamed protein product [Pieris macdunnoughi]